MSGSMSRPSVHFNLAMSTQKRVDAMEMKRESITKKRPGQILEGGAEMKDEGIGRQ